MGRQSIVLATAAVAATVCSGLLTSAGGCSAGGIYDNAAIAGQQVFVVGKPSGT
jgi:hypothetical protein